MPRKPAVRKAKKQTIYMPGQLAERIERFKDRINISQECVTALEIAVSRIEAEEGVQYGKSKVFEYAQDPLTISEVKRTGKISLPTPLQAELENSSPSWREGVMNGWQAGTATIWGMLSASERPPLPFVEYIPKGD